MVDRISAESFVAWMVTQPNRNGTLFLERVVQHYVRCLRSVPLKLDLPLPNEKRDIFACRTMVEFERLCKIFTAAKNFKEIDYANSHNSFSAGLQCYKRYLEHLDHAENVPSNKDDKDGKTTDAVGVISENEPAEDLKDVDFTDLSVCEGTRPDKCFIDGKTVAAMSWSAMYVGVIERLLVSHHKRLSSIKMKTKNGEKPPLLLTSPLAGLTCAKLSNGKYLYINYSTQQYIRLIGMLCDVCGIRKEKINLTYWPSKTEAMNTNIVEKTTLHPNGGTVYSSIDRDATTAIVLVLVEHYTNGFRLDSFIEMERLRKFVNEFLPVPLTLTDTELKSHVKKCGTVFDGKVYVVNAEGKAKIAELVEDYFAGGATAIFYESFFDKHEPWLIEASIVSVEILIDVLRSLFPTKQFSETYFGDTGDNIPEVVKRELFRVWGNDVLLNFETMSDRLPYIPLYRMKQLLGGNADFIWNATGEYTHIHTIEISDEEKDRLRSFAKHEIDKHGYVSIADFPLSDFMEMNFELSQTAVHNAAFRSCLSDAYEQHGKIITRKGDDLTAKDIIEEYCRSLDRCSLEDLLDFERELTGECHRWVPMQAGYDIMVRTDKDSFLADKYFDFNRNGIDNAIEHFIAGGEYVPLRHVTTFAPFPHCGQAWTLFLLESYCRRFSECFRFEVLSVNSTNAGVIVRKHSKLSYHDIMVDAVARSGVALHHDTVLDFLATEGYTSQRRYARITELITQATAKRG